VINYRNLEGLGRLQYMSSRYLNVTDRQTDRQTDESNLITALCTSASRGKNAMTIAPHANTHIRR